MAQDGTGAFFQLSATAISDNTTGLIAEVTKVGIPNPSTAANETTHHGSTGGIREYLPGLVDIGEFSVEMNLVPGTTSDTTCATAATGRALYYFQATVPRNTGTPATWVYSGRCIVTGYDKADVEPGVVMKATLKLKPTGAVTRAAGA